VDEISGECIAGGAWGYFSISWTFSPHWCTEKKTGGAKMRSPIFALFLLSTTAMPVLAQEIPDAASLQNQVEAAVPGFWRIEDFRVIAAVKQGDPISPKALIRFEADVSPSYDLFTATGEKVGPFEVVIPTFDDADNRTLFGTMQLQYQAGQWAGSPVIENPLDNLGQPRDMFSSPTIVQGSEEQTAMLNSLHDSAIEKARVQLEQDLQALKAQYDAKIAAAERDMQTVLDSLTANYSPRIAEEKARLDAELTRLREEYKAKADALKEQMRTKDATEIAELEAELEAKREQQAKAIRDAEAELEKQTTLAERLTAIDAKEAEIEALRAQFRARQLAIFKSFGKAIPLSFRCKSLNNDKNESFTRTFEVKDVRSTGIFGYYEHNNNDGSKGRSNISIALVDGASGANMRFRLTVDFKRVLGSYDLRFDNTGVLKGSATGTMFFLGNFVPFRENAKCDVVATTR
jgi:hypothetical protein